MRNEYPINSKELRKYNLMRYKAMQPSWELVQNVIEKSGLKRLARFEYAWGIPTDTLTLYKNGARDLPAIYWHIFYDFDIVNQLYKPLYQTKTRVKKKQTVLQTNKMILDGRS